MRPTLATVDLLMSPAIAPSLRRPHVQGFRFSVLGCTGRIRIAGMPAARAEAFVADAVRWLRGIEARLTRFSADSLVGRINACAGIGMVQPDADLLAVLDAADLAWRLTAGRFDATSLPLTRLWFDPRRTAWPTAAEVAAARAAVDWRALMRSAEAVWLLRPGMALDLGGVGKEWCVDRLLARATAAGIADCLIELGGDCAASGHQPGHAGWWVALPGAAAALLLCDEALATSGVGSRRRELAGRSVPHLIDARTGRPAGGVLRSVSVLGRDCLTAGIHASDCCLLDDPLPAAIAARSGGLPTWCVAADGRLLGDPRLLTRLHPVGRDVAMAGA
jgi:thiamine biosynthesis lipoprotein